MLPTHCSNFVLCQSCCSRTPALCAQFVLQMSSSNMSFTTARQHLIFRLQFIPHLLSIAIIGRTRSCSVSSPWHWTVHLHALKYCGCLKVLSLSCEHITQDIDPPVPILCNLQATAISYWWAPGSSGKVVSQLCKPEFCKTHPATQQSFVEKWH